MVDARSVRLTALEPEEKSALASSLNAMAVLMRSSALSELRTSSFQTLNNSVQPAVTVEQVFVKPGRRSDGTVEIVEGLTAGDEVVNAGQNRLSNGARVTVNNEVQPVLEKDGAQ